MINNTDLTKNTTQKTKKMSNTDIIIIILSQAVNTLHQLVHVLYRLDLVILVQAATFRNIMPGDKVIPT